MLRLMVASFREKALLVSALWLLLVSSICLAWPTRRRRKHFQYERMEAELAALRRAAAEEQAELRHR
jgi:hypothetical protein